MNGLSSRQLPHTLGREGISPIGLAAVIGVHALVVAALLAYQPTRQLLADGAPVFVRMIEPEPPKPLPVEPPPPPPKAIVKPPPPPPKKAVTQPPPPPVQQLAIPESAPAPVRIEAPVPPPEPPKPVEVAPAPAPSPPAPPVAAAPPPAPPPTPLVPPNFNAAYLSNPPPVYPAASRRLGEEGKVLVRVFVSSEGLPEKLELRSSSGYGRLDDAAMETIKRWKFVPARQGDKAIAAWVIVPIVFTLNQ